jgi:hypothetical protein
MAETKSELINYAIAESAALGAPVPVEKSSLIVKACPCCNGTGLVPTERELSRFDRIERGDARDWHLAPVKLGVTACRPCRSTGHDVVAR